jgi:hypothetical protein
MSDEIYTNYFSHHGREFCVKHYHDSDSGPPWENDCGAGVVRLDDALRALRRGSYERNNKHPWERVMKQDRGYVWVYDMRATREKANEEGWGLGPKEIAKMTERLGRAPTKREIVAQAIEQDFKRHQGWLHDNWMYIGIEVTDILSGDSDSLWGIEDDCEEYVQEITGELASGLHPLAEREEACVLGEN